MIARPLPNSLDSLVRGGALAAMATLALTLLSLGFYFYLPSTAAAQPAASALAASQTQPSDPSVLKERP